jgi:hypothetical protein
MENSMRVWMLSSLVLVLVACGEPQPQPPRWAEYPDWGLKFLVPDDWMHIVDEVAHRRSGTTWSYKIVPLDGAERNFLERLPDSIRPELVNWSKHSFTNVVEGTPEPVTIGGARGLSIWHEARANARADVTRVRYWAVRRDRLLYLFRCVFPPGRSDVDGPVIDRLMASVAWIELPKPTAPPPEFPDKPIQELVQPR